MESFKPTLVEPTTVEFEFDEKATKIKFEIEQENLNSTEKYEPSSELSN